LSVAQPDIVVFFSGGAAGKAFFVTVLAKVLRSMVFFAFRRS
jgi:hypothetical protein